MASTTGAERHFCTLFDAGYLVKAVALHESLERCAPGFRLTILCLDERTTQLVEGLALSNTDVVSLSELEAHDPLLLKAKADRSRFEYWLTTTPALPLYLLDTRPELRETTYIDADLWFFANPEQLFAEMGDASVLIIPHRFAAEYAHYAVNGVYNVQFMTFRRDAHGLAALRWWHDRCIEWCRLTPEDGKFADQKYLDDWPERFVGVHVLQHKGGGLAPWNVTNYDVHEQAGRVLVDDDPLVFFHFHKVQMTRSGSHHWRARGYHIPPYVKQIVYNPYLAALDRSLTRVREVEPGFSDGVAEKVSLGERLGDARASVGRTAYRIPAVRRWHSRTLGG